MGRKRDPRELFHNFQPLIGCGYVLAASHYTMILKQNCVVFRYKRLKTLAELPSTRRSVWRQGNSPEIHYYFWKDRLVECTSRGRESSRCWRMSMAYRLHFRSQAVEKKMHQDLRRWPSGSPLNDPVRVGYQKILWRKVPFAYTRRRHKDPVRIKAHGQIALARDYKSASIHASSSFTDLPPEFILNL
jgi:hypothetical protein